jgi:hypothetical protein
MNEISIAEQRFRDNAQVFKDLGFNTQFPYIQAWIETGKFQHVIGNNNYWGIMSRPNDGYDKVIINGVVWADWKETPDAFWAYAKKIWKLYPDCWKNRNGIYTAYNHGLMTGLYGEWCPDIDKDTGKNYEQSLNSLTEYAISIGNDMVTP